MPSKGNQRASRQAQLNSRKKRTTKPPVVVDSRSLVKENEDLTISKNPEPSRNISELKSNSYTETVPNNVLIYPYMKRELIQILATSCVIFLILLILVVTAFN
jgi:hypothetical protein